MGQRAKNADGYKEATEKVHFERKGTDPNYSDGSVPFFCIIKVLRRKDEAHVPASNSVCI